jgi:hypothetical protein
MGNFIGKSKSTTKAESEFNNFYEIVDNIATYYILTMDFQSLSRLSEKEYCDKLVVLTSDIIERYFNDNEITFLAQRIKDGQETNEMRTEKVKFLNKDNLQNLDVSNDTQKSIKKKRVCIGIAKFYVKIAHIFAAIVMTINPVYIYKDATGQTVKSTLLEKDKIPKGVERKLYKINICDNRIRSLKEGEQTDEQTGDVSIRPNVCDINMENGVQKTLADEPGITELMRLYMDDNYNYSDGTFSGMSEETKKEFKKDLKLFYTTFTGNEDMPETISKFSDIKLRDYSKKPGCQPPNSFLKEKYTINKKDELFVKYADKIKQMIQNAADNQYKLLDVINDLFTYVKDPYSGKRVIRINPNLNDKILQNSVVKTRRFIIDLYIKCESDYVDSIKIFEAIVESKIVETTKKQIDNLKKQASKIINETKKIAQPVVIKEPVVIIDKTNNDINNSLYNSSPSNSSPSNSSPSNSSTSNSSTSNSSPESSSSYNSLENEKSPIPYSTQNNYNKNF